MQDHYEQEYKMFYPITTDHSLSFRFEDGPAAPQPRTVSLLDGSTQALPFPLAPSQTQNTPWKTANKMGGRIPYAGPNDVICGRGSGANNHIGNIRFRKMVKHYQGIYRSAYCKADKPLVALQIVMKLKAMSPPGRFLTKPPVVQQRGGVEPDYWIEVDKFVATRKVCQRLREEKAPTVGKARRRRAPTTIKAEKASIPPQKITVSHESDKPHNDEWDTPIVVSGMQPHNDDWDTPIVVSGVQPHDDEKLAALLSSIIEPDNDEEVEVEDRPAGVATEDRDPDAISNSTIHWHEDHDGRVALGLVDDMPTAATLLGLLGDDFLVLGPD